MDVAAADVLLLDSWIRTVRVASGSRSAARVASLRRVSGKRPARGPSRSARKVARAYRGAGTHE